VVTTVAGNGQAATSGDGGPALSAAVWNPTGLALDDEGKLYVSQPADNRIRRVDTTGAIVTVAGGRASPGFSGDGGPATRASFANPQGLAFDEGGNLYVADTDNRRIRVIDRGGTIRTFVNG
jgi:hypothetical protein